MSQTDTERSSSSISLPFASPTNSFRIFPPSDSLEESPPFQSEVASKKEGFNQKESGNFPPNKLRKVADQCEPEAHLPELEVGGEVVADQEDLDPIRVSFRSSKKARGLPSKLKEAAVAFEEALSTSQGRGVELVFATRTTKKIFDKIASTREARQMKFVYDEAAKEVLVTELSSGGVHGVMIVNIIKQFGVLEAAHNIPVSITSDVGFSSFDGHTLAPDVCWGPLRTYRDPITNTLDPTLTSVDGGPDSYPSLICEVVVTHPSSLKALRKLGMLYFSLPPPQQLPQGFRGVEIFLFVRYHKPSKTLLAACWLRDGNGTCTFHEALSIGNNPLHPHTRAALSTALLAGAYLPPVNFAGNNYHHHHYRYHPQLHPIFAPANPGQSGPAGAKITLPSGQFFTRLVGADGALLPNHLLPQVASVDLDFTSIVNEIVIKYPNSF